MDEMMVTSMDNHWDNHSAFQKADYSDNSKAPHSELHSAD